MASTTYGTRRAPATRTIRLPALRLPTLATVRQVALTVGGLGCLSVAAGMLAIPAGVAAAGVSLLLVNWLSGDGGGKA